MNAVPSFKLYTQRDITEAIPGEGNHTFNRAFAAQSDQVPADAPPSSPSDNTTEAQAEESSSSPGQERPQQALADEFCRIMVHDKAHLSPPKELWTRHSISHLDANVGRAIPLFQESAARRHSFEFLGWYRIVRWELCKGRSKEVQEFVARRKVSQADKPREYWMSVLGQDWAKVELERVNDPLLRNPMEWLGKNH